MRPGCSALALAVTQLRRAPVRTALLVLTVAALIFVVEFLATLSQTLQAFSTGALAHDRADVFVYAADARGSLDASRLPPGLAGRASRVPGVAAATNLGVFDFTVTARGSSFALALFGAGGGGTAAPIRGRVPGPGQGLADSSEAAAGLGIGQRITLRPGGATIRMAGLASGIRYDGVMTVWTTFATWQRAVAAADPGAPAEIANALAVRARPGVSAAVLVRRLNAALPGTEAFTRSAAVADVPGAAIIAATFDLLIATAFAVAVLVVGSVFLLVTIQRLHGWAVLRALGASTAHVGLAVVAEVLLVVLAASALASAALVAVTAASSATFPVRAAPSLVAATAAAMVVGSLGSALLPVRRISRLDPASALART
jgi:putative ABC transport system permease protein